MRPAVLIHDDDNLARPFADYGNKIDVRQKFDEQINEHRGSDDRAETNKQSTHQTHRDEARPSRMHPHKILIVQFGYGLPEFSQFRA